MLHNILALLDLLRNFGPKSATLSPVKVHDSNLPFSPLSEGDSLSLCASLFSIFAFALSARSSISLLCCLTSSLCSAGSVGGFSFKILGFSPFVLFGLSSRAKLHVAEIDRTICRLGV